MSTPRVNRIIATIPADPSSESRHIAAWRIARTQRLADDLGRSVVAHYGDALDAMTDAEVRDVLTAVYLRVCAPHLASGPTDGDVVRVAAKLEAAGDIESGRAKAISRKYAPPSEEPQ